MKRLFNKRQRLLLLMRAGGVCEKCGVKLDRSFHADHRTPWIKGGETTTKNGAALCPKCNLKKGTKMEIELRLWQSEAIEKAIDCYTNIDKHFAVNAAPGAGKTLMATVMAHKMLKAGLIERVIVIAPRAEIVRQWAKDFKNITQRTMMKITKSMEMGAEDISHDIAATWTGISGISDITQDICRNGNVLVIADEVHHAALMAAWGVGANSCLSDATYVLALTGTPNRSDGKESVWLDDAIEAMNYYEVSYKTAVDEGWCVPATFHRHSGQFNVRIEDQLVEITPTDTRFSESIPDVIRENAQKTLTFEKTAKRPVVDPRTNKPRLDSYHSTMLDWAHNKLEDIRKGQKPTAGAIIIAPTIVMAEYFAELISLKWPGERAVVVHSNTGGSQEKIEGFRNSDRKWIVSVNMISEGVDIHRLRVMVFLPMAGTELYFRQAIGRVIRKKDANDTSRAYVIMPEQQNFIEYATRVEAEMGVVDEPEKKEPRPRRDPKEWECNPHSDDGCGAINIGGSTCHACGKSKNPSYELTMEDAYGYREGAIARHYHITEDELKHSEEIEGDVRKLAKESDDPRLFGLLAKIPPELYGMFDDLFAQVRASRGQ